MSLDYDFDRVERHQKRKKTVFSVIGWTLSIGVAITLAWLITEFALEKTNVVDDSMNVTLDVDDRILIDKVTYRFSEPERFDIIVFKKDGKEHSYYSVSRIIGLPGEMIKIENGRVFINGELLEEPMIVDDIFIEGLAAEEILLDEDEYFVLGDNRNNSEDSRFTNVGNVVANEIIGRAWLRTNKFAIIDKLNLKEEVKESDEDSQESTEE